MSYDSWIYCDSSTFKSLNGGSVLNLTAQQEDPEFEPGASLHGGLLVHGSRAVAFAETNYHYICDTQSTFI